MPKAQCSSRPAGLRRVVYGCGRVLQGAGLVLLWWVLLLFAGSAAMGPLLLWSGVACGVFYAGWLCTLWGRKGMRA
ncbi:MAG: hypothetical protein KatS3mg131_0778 [Candidatus Tectimicrobiota bacterium]|nr:MAG: hypothetical protein KatS3mg131_0778 [Candidatus Tectomicrobia bacterium]